MMAIWGMKALVLLLLATTVSCKQHTFFNTSVKPPKEHHKILFMLPTYFSSHILTTAPLMTALASRGHEVHMLCDRTDRFHFPNVTCLYADVKMDDFDRRETSDDFVSSAFKLFDAAERAANITFSSRTFLDLYNKTEEYDMIIMDYLLFYIAYPYVHGRTYGLLSTIYLDPTQSAVFGNVQNPAYFTGCLADFPKPYSLLDRLKNLGLTLLHPCYVWIVSCISKSLIQKTFPGTPSRFEVERNASLHLITTSVALNGPLGLYPTQVPVPGLIIRPNLPLPKDFAEFVAGDVPVIHSSFGTSHLNTELTSKAVVDAMVSVFRRLPYKFIFKIIGQQKHLDGNILFHDDVPQQDILAHPNVKLFISHGGLGGIQEAVYHSTPIIVIPFNLDNRQMANAVVNAGVGIELSWTDFSEKEFEDAIEEIINNSKYQEKIDSLSRIFRDEQEHSLDRAVYWTEYVARTRGAPHLQPPGKLLSWVEIFCLDVVAIVLAGCSVLFFVSRWTIRRLVKTFFVKKEKIL